MGLFCSKENAQRERCSAPAAEHPSDDDDDGAPIPYPIPEVKLSAEERGSLYASMENEYEILYDESPMVMRALCMMQYLAALCVPMDVIEDVADILILTPRVLWIGRGTTVPDPRDVNPRTNAIMVESGFWNTAAFEHSDGHHPPTTCALATRSNTYRSEIQVKNLN